MARCGVIEQVLQHAAEGRDAGAGGEEDVIVISWGSGEDEALATGAGDAYLIAGLEIAEVVAGDSEEETLGFVVLVDEAFDGGGENFAFAVFASRG